jgi:MFS family permease
LIISPLLEAKKLTRARLAIYFFSVNIAAYLVGSNLMGYLSDKFGATENPAMMRYTLLVCPVSCLLAAVCLWFGSKALERKSEI